MFYFCLVVFISCFHLPLILHKFFQKSKCIFTLFYYFFKNFHTFWWKSNRNNTGKVFHSLWKTFFYFLSNFLNFYLFFNNFKLQNSPHLTNISFILQKANKTLFTFFKIYIIKTEQTSIFQLFPVPCSFYAIMIKNKAR